MEQQVFRYRSGGSWALIVFLLIWGGGATIMPNLTPQSNVTVNGHPASSGEAVAFKVVFTLLGILALVGAARTFLSWLNERIEVEGESLQWIGWNNRVKLECRSDQIKEVTKSTQTSVVFETTVGPLKVGKEIDNFGTLRLMLENAKDGFVGWKDRLFAGIRGHYIPPTIAGNYRMSSYMFFSVVWLGLIFAFLYASFALGSSSNQATPWPVYLVIAVFALPGIWMQMTCWNETISLGPEGIKWIDFRRRTRVDTPLDRIFSFETQLVQGSHSSSTQLKIYTDQGTIGAMSYLSNFDQLKSELQKVIDSRKVPVGEPVVKAEDAVSPFSLPDVDRPFGG